MSLKMHMVLKNEMITSYLNSALQQTDGVFSISSISMREEIKSTLRFGVANVVTNFIMKIIMHHPLHDYKKLTLHFLKIIPLL